MPDTTVKPGIGYVDTLITNMILPTLPVWHSLRFTPNGLTTLGLICSAACVYFLYKRNFYAALAFMIARMYFDYADGLLARKYGQTSVIGDWYDHTTDMLFNLGLILVLVFSKYKTGTKSWFVNNIKYISIGLLLVFGALFSIQMGCIEKEYRKGVDDSTKETTISRLRYLCPSNYEYIINAFDNGTLYIVIGIIFYLFCKIGKP